MGEAQVHAVTGEEGASIQRELHAGWVWDGLTQQGHDSACRGRRRAAAKGTNVACAVEDLEKEGEEFKAEFINQARFKQAHFLLNFMLLSCSEPLLMKSIQFVSLCFCQC